MSLSNCKSCDALIRWVATVNKKKMPLDAHPHEEGNILLDKGVAHVLSAERVAMEKIRNTPLYLSHFATCKNAATHRSK